MIPSNAAIIRKASDDFAKGDILAILETFDASITWHVPGHQSLFVRLPKTGAVLLSGDFVHLRSNWEARRVPSFNYNIEQSVGSVNEMDAFIKATGAQLWINHDSEQSRAIPKAPAFFE